MSDTNDSAPAPEADVTSAAAPPPYSAPTGEVVAAPAYAAPVYGSHAAPAPLGKIRGTGACILLTIVTLGFYTWYWYYKTSDEMKQHSGQGVGGPIALLLAVLVGIVMPFISPSEVGKLYERRGQKAPVSGATGLWYILLGWFFFIGAFVWFVKTNGALNAYWRSQGAQG